MRRHIQHCAPLISLYSASFKVGFSSSTPDFFKEKLWRTLDAGCFRTHQSSFSAWHFQSQVKPFNTDFYISKDSFLHCIFKCFTSSLLLKHTICFIFIYKNTKDGTIYKHKMVPNDLLTVNLPKYDMVTFKKGRKLDKWRSTQVAGLEKIISRWTVSEWCTSSSVVGIMIEGIMNAKKYSHILIHSALPYGKHVTG